jgi:carbon storage regulator CsrA
MLVLTRKQQETIQIGENITITIVRIKGNTVRVGIEAPPDVRVVRGEIAAEKEPPRPLVALAEATRSTVSPGAAVKPRQNPPPLRVGKICLDRGARDEATPSLKSASHPVAVASRAV